MEKYKILRDKYGPLKMLQVPLSQIIMEMEAVPCKDLAGRPHSTGYGQRYHESPTYNETLAGQLETIKKRVGICFGCVRGGADAECSSMHK